MPIEQEQLYKKFSKLENNLPILTYSNQIIKHIAQKIIPENNKKKILQNFYYNGNSIPLNAESLQKVDIELKNCLNANINLKHNTPKQKKIANLAEALKFNSNTLINTLLNFIELPENYIYLLVEHALSDAYKTAYLEKDNENTTINQNKLSLKLGADIIKSITSNLDVIFVRKLNKIISNYSSIETLLNDSTKKQFKKQFKHYPKYQEYLKLIISSYIVNTYDYFKDNIKKKNILISSCFCKIIEHYDAQQLKKALINDLNLANITLHSYYKIVGYEIIEQLCLFKILNKTKKNNFNVLEIKEIQLFFNVSRYICRFSSYNSKEITLKSTNNVLIGLNKYKSMIQKKKASINITKNKLKQNKSKMEHVRYQINFEFLSIFLDKFIDLLNNDAETIYRNNSLLNFFGNVFGINMLELCQNNPNDKPFFIKLIKELLNFNPLKLTKFCIKEYLVFSKRLCNIAFNRKFMLNELLFQLAITIHFDFFYEDWYFDYRGRCYTLQSSITPYIPISRQFISFYQKKPALNKNIHNLNKALLLTQIKTLLINEKNLNLTASLDVALLDKNIKFDSIFQYINLCSAYLNYDKKSNVCHFYSLDSRNSGFQIMSLLTKDKNLAQTANLLQNNNLKNNNDLYTLAKEHIINILLSLKLLKVNLSYTVIRYICKFNAVYTAYLKNLNTQYKNKPKELQKILLLSKYNFCKDYLITNNITILPNLTLIDKHMKLVLSKKLRMFIKKQKANDVLANNIICCMTLQAYLKLHKILNNKHIFININRNLLKTPFMTHFYNSTLLGKTQQIKTALINNILIQGYMLTNNVHDELNFLSTIIAQILTPWVNDNFSKAMEFSKILSKVIKESTFNSYTLESSYFGFNYIPYKSIIKQFRIGKKRSRLFIPTFEINYNTVQKSMIANTIQFCDAIICIIFTKIIPKNIMFFTIHDRFFISPYYAYKLVLLIQKAYIGLFKENIIETNFYNTPFMEIISKNDNAFDVNQLSSNLSKVIFVKP